MSDMEETGERKEPRYEFEDIGQQLIDVLLKSAADQVNEAQQLLEETEVLTESLKTRLLEHAALLDGMNGRMKTFGSEILSAHKKFINGVK